MVKVVRQTGWQIYLEPATEFTTSATFKSLPTQEALRLLLGQSLNFALLPQTNGLSRLYVFHTTLDRATQQVESAVPGLSKPAAEPIPGELIVRLKPGANIDDLARQLGATVIGRLDSLNAYRLKFDDASATAAAQDTLASNPDATSVESNYAMVPPEGPAAAPSGMGAPLNLTLKPPSPSGQIIVGLVDTPVQSLGNGLDAFLMPAVSVADPAQPDPSVPTHGTSMAETILTSLQSVSGGSTSVKILPVDVYGSGTTANTLSVAQGIAAAVNAGANPINLSLGGTVSSSVLEQVIQSAHDQGVAIFAAAGNEPVTTAVYPAAYPGVTAVTAADSPGHLASYANRGDFVQMMAPGSIVVDYQNQAFQVVGTSTASAFAAGVDAGLADQKGKTPQQADAAMLASPVFKPATSPGAILPGSGQ